MTRSPTDLKRLSISPQRFPIWVRDFEFGTTADYTESVIEYECPHASRRQMTSSVVIACLGVRIVLDPV
jgi:hypothetical protein